MSEKGFTPDGGPVFPSQPLNSAGMPRCEAEPGMTLRDYFAAKAMAALIAQPGISISKHTPEGLLTVPARVGIPPLAYEYADAMLAARSPK